MKLAFAAAAALAALFIGGAAFAGDAAQLKKELRYCKAVWGTDKTPAGQDALFSIELDSEVYGASMMGFEDLRLFVGNKEIPYALSKVKDKDGKGFGGYAAREYSIRQFSVRQESHKITSVVIDTRKEPLRKFELDVKDAFFDRAVSLECTNNGGRSWEPVAGGRLSRESLNGAVKENLAIIFPETRAVIYKLLIRDGDSGPLKISAVKSYGTSYSLELLGKPEDFSKLTLYYGGDVDNAPEYDIASMLAKMSKPEPRELALGSFYDNPMARKGMRPINTRNALIGLAIATAALLGALLYRNVRRMKLLQSE